MTLMMPAIQRSRPRNCIGRPYVQDLEATPLQQLAILGHRVFAEVLVVLLRHPIVEVHVGMLPERQLDALHQRRRIRRTEEEMTARLQYALDLPEMLQRITGQVLNDVEARSDVDR